jgi:hypothetical protein
MVDLIKLFILGIISTIVSFLHPIQDAMFVLMFVFFGDMFVGIFADLIGKKDKFKAKKFMLAFASVAIYLSIMASVYIIGKKMGDTVEFLFIDKMITYVFIYFYIANILKNLKVLFTKRRPIFFLDFLLGLEFVKRIPSLDAFLRQEKGINTEKQEDSLQKN